ncbi:hypothetical protein RUM43_014785 [Polyplax serrata]|uniref:Uncharacterized protein n=1 Tax=Polyplax serrata TaxID=468196 RepID=A0AAN8NY10_POLSC
MLIVSVPELANYAFLDVKEGDKCCLQSRESSWTNQARDVLCDLTHVAMWKSLMAKIHTYRDRPSGLKREGSPIPCVELFDIQGESTVDVAEELVQRGFALWDHQADSSVLEKKAEFNKTKNS